MKYVKEVRTINKDTKAVKCACIIVAILALSMIFGSLGGTENGAMQLGAFVIIMIAMFAVITLCTVCYYKMLAIEDCREEHSIKKRPHMRGNACMDTTNNSCTE